MAAFEHPIRVRFCEVDEYGFVWHGHYLAWFEAARIEMLREVDLTPRLLLEIGYLVPVFDLGMVCKKPIESDAAVTVHCSIKPTEKAMLTFHYNLIETETGETCVTGFTSHIVMNRDKKMLYFLPDEIRDPIERIMKKYPAPSSTKRP